MTEIEKDPLPPAAGVFASVSLLVLLQIAAGVIFVVLARDLGLLATSAGTITEDLGEFAVTPAFFAGSVAINGVLCIGIAVGGAGLGRLPIAERLRARAGPGVLAAAVASLALLCLSQVLSSIHSLVADDVATSLGDMERVVQASTGAAFVAVLLSAGLLAAAGEEIFFRGFVQTRLRARWGVWPAILITAAAFGLLHFDVVHSLMAFGMGLVLGWIVEVTGSIRPAIAAHVINNTVWILTAGHFDETAFGIGIELAVLGGCLCLGAAAIALLHRLTHRGRSWSCRPREPPTDGTGL